MRLAVVLLSLVAISLAQPLWKRIAFPALDWMTIPAIAQVSTPTTVTEPQPTPTEPPQVRKPHVTQGSNWNLCGRSQRKTKRVKGFTGDTAGTYIRNIQVNIHGKTYSTVTLDWANADLSTETLPVRFNASPGAGRCDVDCRSIADSKLSGSRCTPLSPPLYAIQGYDCVLEKYPDAKFVTWLHWERGIAFHAYSVPPYPASHGCIRLATKNRDAEWIYDNSLAGITQVKINWDKSEGLGGKCWRGEVQIDRPKKY